MELIVTFFRDILDGTLYTVVAVICGILICSCIGYLGEQYLKKQEAKKQYEATHAAIAGAMVDGAELTTKKSLKPEGVTSLEQEIVAPMSEVSDKITTGK